MLNLKKLDDVEGKKQFQVKISNRIATLQNLDIVGGVKRAWEDI